MDNASEAILKLEPVTFRYKEDLDPEHIPQFGLIAEEVEKVNPDLVVRGENGKVNTVRYEAVNPPPFASLFSFQSRASTCFLVLGCASRAEIMPSSDDLFVWDQVIQTDQLILRTLLPLSSTLPRICVLLFLRRK